MYVVPILDGKLCCRMIDPPSKVLGYFPLDRSVFLSPDRFRRLGAGGGRGWIRNTPIRRRVQADVLCEALKAMLPEECPNKAELLQLLAKLPSEGEHVVYRLQAGGLKKARKYARFKSAGGGPEKTSLQ